MKAQRDQDPTVRRAQRVLLMVHELHKLGYQRLRIVPGMSPSGMHWRCAITPTSNVLSTHGAMPVNYSKMVNYSSADKNVYFGWKDAKYDTARELAVKFIERFPEVTHEGLGRDWVYTGWYVEMLGLAERGIFPIAYSDLDDDPGWLNTTKGCRLLPMPPSGEGKPMDDTGTPCQEEKPKRSRYPMNLKNLDHPDNPPASLMAVDLEFLKLAQMMLTPEEIKQAAEEGTKLHTEAMKKKEAEPAPQKSKKWKKHLLDEGGD